MNHTSLHTAFLLIGMAVVTVGGAACFGYSVGYFCYVPGTHMSGLALTEWMILHTAIGAALFVVVTSGYFLLRAARHSRLGSFGAIGIFLLLAINSIFLPGLFMVASRTFWPDVFYGDAGWNFVLAPLVTAVLMAGLLVAFITGLVLCRRSRVDADQAAERKAAALTV